LWSAWHFSGYGLRTGDDATHSNSGVGSFARSEFVPEFVLEFVPEFVPSGVATDREAFEGLRREMHGTTAVVARTRDEPPRVDDQEMHDGRRVPVLVENGSKA
jgi:hypothetical protein